MKPDTNETSRSKSNVTEIFYYITLDQITTHFLTLIKMPIKYIINAIPSMHLSINKALSNSTKTTTIH